MLVMLDGILFQSLLSSAQRNNCSNLVWSVVRYKLEDEICGFAFIRNFAYFDSHNVFIKVCNTAHNFDCRRKKPPKFVPLKLEICLNYAYSLDLCCYNIV